MAPTVHTADELTELECLLPKDANLHKISYEENENKLSQSCKLRCWVFEAENIMVLLHHLLKGCPSSFSQAGDDLGIVLPYQW